jgi:hypothetical protein
MTPIVWHSMKQSTISTSMFGAEFVAMKQGMGALRGLWYKLWMMGVQLNGPSYVYGDNMSVIHNTQWPKSTVKKKSNSVCYHTVHESVAMGKSLTGHISMHDNPADICTKIIPSGMKWDHFVSLILYDLNDSHSWWPPTMATKCYLLKSNPVCLRGLNKVTYMHVWTIANVIAKVWGDEIDKANNLLESPF